MDTARERLPNRRPSRTREFSHGNLRYVATGSDLPNGRLGEVFIDCSKVGSAAAIFANDCAVLASLLLQHGVSPDVIAHSISGPLKIALALLVEAK